jgi:hypothetical protein
LQCLRLLLHPQQLQQLLLKMLGVLRHCHLGCQHLRLMALLLL